MNFTVIAFALMGMVALSFLAATVAREWTFQGPRLRQTGDSTLSRKSVNWLGATALIAALVICLVIK